MHYGHILIHVFYETVRKFYDMEGLWADAKRVTVSDYVDLTEPAGKNGVDE